LTPLVEIELKFQIEPARLETLRRAVAGTAARAQTVRLQARYFDTPDDRLAAAGLALRLRREGRGRWVQTLKGRGDGLLRRLEHEVMLPTAAPVAIDLSRHAGTQAAAAMREALGADGQCALVERFATEISRTRRVVRARGAAGETAAIELAYDLGRISAQGPDGPVQRAVAEVEFELLEGSPKVLLTLASRWVRRHGLWLDVRSKAERGQALAAGAPLAPVWAQAPLIARRMAPSRALAAMVQAALAQALPNMAAVAEAREAGPEHLHQLRVGLRRLRTALREFSHGAAGALGFEAAQRGALEPVLTTLGDLRDRDVVAQTLSPARAAARAAGLPLTAGPEPCAVGLTVLDTAVLRERGFNLSLLALIGLTLATQPDGHGRPLIEVAQRRLMRLHKRVAADGADFAALDDAARHALRKRVKRLRYSVEFVAPLFAAKDVARYLDLLKPAQESLGDLNDVAVSEAACRAAMVRDSGDAFVLGWLCARREALVASAAARLQAVAAAPRFWKSRK